MYKHILYPVDISEEGSWLDSLPVVIDLINAFGSKLHIMTVLCNGSMSIVQQYLPQGSAEKLVEDTKIALKEFVSKNIPEHFDVQRIVGRGAVYECIIKTADQVAADLIVMSAHRPELKDYLLGPNAAKVVRHTNRSVLVVREKTK